MTARGLEPEFPPAALAEAQMLLAPSAPFGEGVRDLRDLPWSSIDNDDSRDLDQLTVAFTGEDGTTRVLVAVADVSASVTSGSALDAHAAKNTTSVYTASRTFPMLPEHLSTDLTSLGPGVDRLAILIEIPWGSSSPEAPAKITRAVVRNHAKLTYTTTGAWLEGRSDEPAAVRTQTGLAANLRIQDTVAQKLRAWRHAHGALELASLEARVQLKGDEVTGLTIDDRGRARDLIEDFMIAANGAIARFLTEHRFPVLRRVVRAPERWPRIVALAVQLGDTLPVAPDAPALHAFLLRRRAADALRFPDLSLAVIKLLGRGAYEASFPGDDVTGHFGLAVSDYTHSTAPNRRYPDLITQRLVHAALAGEPVPFTREALQAIAAHCTKQEDAAQKIERLLRKAAAACLLEHRVGEEFAGIVTGASEKGTWVRLFEPPVEGRLEAGAAGLDVGDRVQVKLVRTDPEHGFIDLERIVKPSPAV
jgi:exoribonuclease-2